LLKNQPKLDENRSILKIVLCQIVDEICKWDENFSPVSFCKIIYAVRKESG
jgi:hypothetical protein